MGSPEGDRGLATAISHTMFYSLVLGSVGRKGWKLSPHKCLSGSPGKPGSALPALGHLLHADWGDWAGLQLPETLSDLPEQSMCSHDVLG